MGPGFDSLCSFNIVREEEQLFKDKFLIKLRGQKCYWVEIQRSGVLRMKDWSQLTNIRENSFLRMHMERILFPVWWKRLRKNKTKTTVDDLGGRGIQEICKKDSEEEANVTKQLKFTFQFNYTKDAL